MAILADGSSYLDRYVEGVIEAESFAASRRLLFLHLTLSEPRRLSRSSGMCSRIGSETTLSKLGEAPTYDDAVLMILRRYRALAGWGRGLLVLKHRAEIAHVEPARPRG